ncbi:MAG TPA: YbhB/YbcL family Raf kinase inhibitor-like protein [Candidatus Nitrosotalea sp.]|nr:YbhB/YbcL family Raf kinase inhibitor-like protein [Candidatus Nitrosotalea sp.]
MRTALVLLAAVAIIPLSCCNASSQQVPSWVKNNAKWWSEGQVSDVEFLKGMQYLIDQGLMDVPHHANGTSGAVSVKIPSWVRTDAGWWAEGVVPDQEFLNGMEYLVDAEIVRIQDNDEFMVSSPAFADNGTIPSQYTCDGGNKSPPLVVLGVPSSAKSLALTVVDIDAPSGPFTHWTMWNIQPNQTSLAQGMNASLPQGTSSAGTVGYHGPCPPLGTHRYVFSLYALDRVLDLGQGASRADLEDAMQGHVIEKTQIIGTYARH